VFRHDAVSSFRDESDVNYFFVEIPSKTLVWKLQEDATGPLTPDQVYAMVGRTLFNLHQLEGLLKIAAGVLTKSMQPGEGEIDATGSIWEMRRDTLGRILWNVRNVVNVEPGFLKVINRLLRRRNAFAHKLARHTPFSLRSKNWLRNVSRFLWALENDLEAVHYVFTRYLHALLLQHSGDPSFIFVEEEVTTFLRLKRDSAE
jgi:hypothetical protein